MNAYHVSPYGSDFNGTPSGYAVFEGWGQQAICRKMFNANIYEEGAHKLARLDADAWCRRLNEAASKAA